MTLMSFNSNKKTASDYKLHNPLIDLLLKLLVVRCNNIDKFKLNKYVFIAKSYLSFLKDASFVIGKYGPLSNQIQRKIINFERQNFFRIGDSGKIYDIDTSRLFYDIEEYKVAIPNVVKNIDLIIVIIKILESEIIDFPDKELFTTMLYFIREEGIYSLDRLFDAVINEKGDKFSRSDFNQKNKLLNFFYLIRTNGDLITLNNNPFEDLSLKLLKYSKKVAKFMARNSNKILNANKEFLMRNFRQFKFLYKELQKTLSSYVGNGLS